MGTSRGLHFSIQVQDVHQVTRQGAIERTSYVLHLNKLSPFGHQEGLEGRRGGGVRGRAPWLDDAREPLHAG